MKIAFVNDVVFQYATNSPDAEGGAERFQWLLARALAARGWSVHVAVTDMLPAGHREVIDQVVFNGVGRGPGHVLFNWYHFLLKERPTWWFWRCANHLWGPAVAMARTAGVRSIFSVGLDRDVIPRKALFRRPQLWPLYYWGLAQSDLLFVQHREQFNMLPQHWQKKAHLLPNMVGRPDNIVPHRERLPYVAWVAILRQVKRADLLIDIARQLPDTRFVVCGGPSTFMSDPGYGETIVNALRAQPNITYLGKVAPARALEILANAAVCLSTSDEEGFPNVFLEAWSVGTPVVSLRIDPDQVIERNGLGVVTGGSERTVATLRDLLEKPEKRDRIASRTRQFVNDHHSEQTVANQFNQAVESSMIIRNSRDRIARQSH